MLSKLKLSNIFHKEKGKNKKFSEGELEKIKLGLVQFHEDFEVFDQGLYLELNPDIELAINEGVIGSAIEHFFDFGLEEIVSGKRYWKKNINNASIIPYLNYSSDKVEVNVLCRTYNHEGSIRKALDGFLMQKTKFKFTVLIGDDVSTDNTVDIVNEYCEKYPEIFKLYVNSENIGPVMNLVSLSKRVDGQFVAVCEGDDYWIDPLKLQKQADFLINNDDYSICCHRVIINYDGADKLNEIEPKNIDETTGFEQLIQGNYIYMNSVMYRWNFPIGLNENNFNVNAMPADWQLHLLHSSCGKIKMLSDVMGVYNRHENGIWINSDNQLELHKKYGFQEIEFFKTFENYYDGEFKSKLQSSQCYIFKLLANYYIDNEEYELLFEMSSNNTELFKKVFDEFGFTPGFFDFSTVESFSKSLIQQETISVVLTSYNHEEYVEEAIESILNQRGAFTLRIIIGDDCSTDKTYKILKSYQKKYPEIIQLLPSEINVGVRKNLKRCFEASDSKYLAICEGDDYWNSKLKLQKQISVLRNNPESVMAFNWLMLLHEEDGTFTPHPQQQKLNKKVLSLDDLVQVPIIGNFSGCMYRKKAIDSITEQYYEDPIAFDWLFNVLIARQGSISFVKEMLSVYRIHSKGLWSSNTAATMQEKIKATQKNFFNYFDDLPTISSMKPSDVIDVNKYRNSSNIKLKYNIDKASLLGDKLQINGWVIKDKKEDTHLPKVLGLMDPKTRKVACIFPMEEVSRKDVVKYFTGKRKVEANCGFNSNIPLKVDPTKSYLLSICYIKHKVIYSFPLNIGISFENNSYFLKEM